MPDDLTEYQVRTRLAKEHGIEVSHGQLVNWHAWGLIEHDDAGRWAPHTVERAVRIHQLGKTVDSYARRVILLRGDGIPVPPQHVQRAMAEVAPKIQPHLRKMKRVERALGEVFRFTAPSAGRGGSLPKGWRPPPREEWAKLIQRTDVERFRVAMEGQYYFLGVLKTFVPGDGDDALSQIPDEELLTLMTVRHLASQEALARRASEGDEES